jgi:hypothetical protein
VLQTLLPSEEARNPNNASLRIGDVGAARCSKEGDDVAFTVGMDGDIFEKDHFFVLDRKMALFTTSSGVIT